MNDQSPFRHGSEGTHSACIEMVKKYGDQVSCCACTRHQCETNKPTKSLEDKIENAYQEFYDEKRGFSTVKDDSGKVYVNAILMDKLLSLFSQEQKRLQELNNKIEGHIALCAEAKKGFCHLEWFSKSLKELNTED